MDQWIQGARFFMEQFHGSPNADEIFPAIGLSASASSAGIVSSIAVAWS